MDYVLLDRYMAGECTLPEARRVNVWLAAHPVMGDVVAQLRTGSVTALVDAAVDWERVRAAMERRKSAMLISTDQRPLWLMAFKSQAMQRMILSTAVALVLAILVLNWTGEAHHVGRRMASSAVTYETGQGEQQSFMLPDGSAVALGEASRLEVPSDFRTGGHPLRVQGEAAFTVQHQSGVAFTVMVSGTLARVLGTTFMVRRYAADTATVVVVHDGKVTVQAGGMRSVVLTAGRLAVIGQGAIRIAPEDELNHLVKGGEMNPLLLLYSVATMSGAVPAHAVLPAGADSILTVDALTKMTKFWTLLNKVDKVQDTSKDSPIYVIKQGKLAWDYANHRYGPGSIESEDSVPMGHLKIKKYGLDFKKLAAMCPAVADALKEAGLSPEQMNFYRGLMQSAYTTRDMKGATYRKSEDDPKSYSYSPAEWNPTAVEEANIKFLNEHEKERSDLMERETKYTDRY